MWTPRRRRAMIHRPRAQWHFKAGDPEIRGVDSWYGHVARIRIRVEGGSGVGHLQALAPRQSPLCRAAQGVISSEEGLE